MGLSIFRLPAANLIHRYNFSTDGSDSIGAAHGTLEGGATISGGAVQLNGVSAYVNLPNDILQPLDSLTIEVWLTDNYSGNWARIFDFGNSTAGEDVPASGTQYLFLSSQSGGGTLRGAITLNANSGEQLLEWAGTRLPAGELKQVVWTMDGDTQIGRLYVDGTMVAENTAMSVRPSDMGSTLNNWIGRSQWSADAYLNGSVTEFRIYDGALTEEEVEQDFELGPDTVVSIGPVEILTQPQSLSVTELSAATFSIFYGGSSPVSFQWFRDNSPIPNATNDSYTIPSVSLSDDDAVFKVALTNRYNSSTFFAISSNAVLSVSPDLSPPVLLRAESLFPNEVRLEFSEGLEAGTATNQTNYVITFADGSLAVIGARFGSSISNIILTTATQSLATNYTVTVNGVRDRAAAANLIAANSEAHFSALAFLIADIGSPAIPGMLTAAEEGFAVTAGGSGIGRTSDQFTFAYENYTNNFDLKLRVATLEFVDAWTRAGLMARDGFTTNAVFAASFATPGPAGCHFESRNTVGGNATMAGSFPVNYPDTWLRLRRTGNVFDGFASLDGQTWEFLGSTTISMSSVVQVGFALTAGDASRSTAAIFDGIANASGTIATNSSLPFEPLGPCSRRTALVISEIMYNPPGSWGDDDNLEFVELWNSGLVTEDLTGHKLDGEIEYQFPDGANIAPGQFLVVARDPSAAQSFYGVTCLGPYDGKLSNSGGTLRLLNELGGVLLEIEYETTAPWPVAADGAGHSLVLSRPSYGENDPRAWSASDVIGGSPGTFEHYGNEPARGVVINEFLAHTDPPQVDFVELFNNNSQDVDLSGAWLSDDAGSYRYRIANGTTIPARGRLVFTQDQLGFALSAEGESIFLVNSNQTRVLDAVAFDGQENGVSTGRYPDGAPGLQPLSAVTQGTVNASPLIRSLVINEIMYHPVSESEDDEYVEIYNRGTTNVSLANWNLAGGVNFVFPTNAAIAAGQYIVVAKNVTNLLAKYPQLNGTNTFGNYSGALKNSGERIALAMPDDLISTNTDGVVSTNIFYITVDEVTYCDGGRWGEWSDGGGSSLELIDPDSDNRLPSNWADSDESAKGAWTTIDVTNVLENGMASPNEGSSQGTPNRCELFLQGAGEAIVDNLEFHGNTGANLVANGDFTSGTNGWTLGGVLRNSFVENGVGVGGSAALHLVAVARGDTGPNKVCRALASTPATGAPNTGTMRARVRWLRGSPYLLLRLRGNWMEAAQRLNVPSNCGTPGLPNSRLVANAGPAITDVSHAPVLPAAGQAVVVTARVSDPDGLASAQLKYRVDPSITYSTLNMTDNGAGGDAVAGDGLYSATISGHSSGTLIAFVVTSTDAFGASSQFPDDAPARECLVRWGETLYAGSIGTYRLWITASNVNFWTAREKNANDLVDATFVYGNTRAIYNVGTMYSGSPFHVPAYNGPVGSFACDYEVNFNPDEKFLGSEPFVLTGYDVNGDPWWFNDDSAQVDLTGTWIGRKLGQQYNYRRDVHVVVNGLHRGTIYDDTQQPNSEMLDEYFPDDSDGQLRKVESWFEFANDAQTQGSIYATIDRFNQSTGEIDAKRYRWNWRPRATRNPDNWSDFLSLVAAVNDTSSPNYEAQVRTWMDVPNFLRPIITHHICGSWDSYAYERGKNMYAYKPDGRPWRLLLWDIELALGATSNPATDSIYNMFDKTLLNLITNRPAFHREYLAGFQEALETALAPGVANAILDERYASFQQNNVALASPQFIENYLTQRRASLQMQLPSASFAVNNPAYQIVSGNNAVTLNGSAPLNVATILINGAAYPITWTSVTTWSVTVPLNSGTNVLAISAKDRHGNLLAGDTGSVTVNYTGSSVAPEGRVVFNETMFQPDVPGADYVELYNTDPTTTFDLSNWQISELNYVFPSGSTLPPNSYLVLAEDAFTFNQTYGQENTAFDEFAARLDLDGQTLTLLRPAAGTNQMVVDRVRYEAAAPWPTVANGVSLQLVDAAQDNSRVANWQVRTTNTISAPPPASLVLLAYTDNWKYMQTASLDSVNWTDPGYDDSVWPSGPGLLAFENNTALTGLILTALDDPRDPPAGLSAGHADYFRKTLVLTNSLDGYIVNASAYVDDGAIFYVNGNEISPRIRMDAGTVVNTTSANSQPPGSDATSPDTFTIPTSAFVVGTNVIAVEVHQVLPTSSDVVFGMSLTANYSGGSSAQTNLTRCTPGTANSVADTLPPFPPVWLNEVQADNVTGPTDNFGQHDPWVELYNHAATNFSLTGYYLTDTYTNLTQWAFPANTAISPNGFVLIWCDNQTNQTAGNSVHAGFALGDGDGHVALTRILNNSTQIVDYLNYASVPANWSYGDVPDGQPFYRCTMFLPTPNSTNNAASAPLTIFINEWLADNQAELADPADGGYEDWFELYNPGTNAVDLGGNYLTDDLANKFKFQVPANGHYIVPAGGFLLVWADNESNQNSLDRADLHADFALSKGGEEIGLFAPDGTVIDAVTFGAQSTDVSQGRFPNGGAHIFSMTTPTPRTSNIIPNTAPVLSAIDDQFVHFGQTLQFTATATDEEAGVQRLTFSITHCAGGATISPAGGVFSWTVTDVPAPSTNSVTICITDDGTPPMSDTATFSVIVEPPPRFAQAVPSGNGTVALTFDTLPGQRYQLEYKSNLDDPAWTPEGLPIDGDGNSMQLNAGDGTVSQRFYRLVVLP